MQLIFLYIDGDSCKPSEPMISSVKALQLLVSLCLS